MGTKRHLGAVVLACLWAACAARTTPADLQTFHSRVLGREMAYRVFVPDGARAAPVVYLLHGHGGDQDDWFAGTEAAMIAARLGLAIVTPDGADSWYINGLVGRWMDYIVEDLVAEVEDRWPVARTREGRAIAGLSMGGYGAINIALQYPDRFALAASMSGALDTTRAISVFDPRGTRPDIPPYFGPAASATRAANDIYARARTADPPQLPYLYLDCGTADPWFGPNREFAALLADRAVAHEFHAPPGNHDWAYWNRQVAVVLDLAARRLEKGLGSLF